MKNMKHRFVRNLIGHIYWEFYEGDVIIVT